MIETCMIERKKEVAREIAYMFLFGDIQKVEELDLAVRRLYVENTILFPWRHKKEKAERTFLFVASKYIFGIDLNSYKPFLEISKEDCIYRKIRETRKVDKTELKGLGRPEVDPLSEMMRINLNHRDLNLVSDEESVRFYSIISMKFRRWSHIMMDLIKGYVGNKILEGVLDGEITNRREKEEFKMRLCGLYFIEAPSDKGIFDRHVTNNSHIDFTTFDLENILNITETAL